MSITSGEPTSTAPPRSRRGFAGMDPQRQREIARAGGRAAHEQGSAHEFTSNEARLAGLKSRSSRAARAQAAAPTQASEAG